MMEEVFGCTTPLSAGTQRDSFNALVEETLGDDCAYDTVLEIHEKLNDLIESQKDEPEPVVLTKSEVKRLFEECGVEDEKLQNFDEQYELAAGEKSALVASNITNTRKFEIKTPDVVIHVAPDRAELVETRIIDGRKCLVIPMESEIELNGIRVSTLNSVKIHPQNRFLLMILLTLITVTPKKKSHFKGDLMNDKKILFFDIDGTLLTPHPFKVPESTSRALTKAHENGHLLFINTGRTKVMMPSALSELHFDGYIYGCGTHIYMDNKLLFFRTVQIFCARKP